MQRPVPLGAAALALILAALPAVAKEGGPKGPVLDAFEAFDADGDGRITREEVAAARRAAVAGLDANGDGVLTPQEITAFRMAREQKRSEDHVARLMAERDLNQDGRLSADEVAAGPEILGPAILGPEGMPERMVERLFSRADADRDGVVTRAEAEAARAEKPRHRGPHPHGPGDHDGDRDG